MRITFSSEICTVIYVKYFVNSQETIFGEILFVQKKIATLRTAPRVTFFKTLKPNWCSQIM